MTSHVSYIHPDHQRKDNGAPLTLVPGGQGAGAYDNQVFSPIGALFETIGSDRFYHRLQAFLSPGINRSLDGFLGVIERVRGWLRRGTGRQHQSGKSDQY